MANALSTTAISEALQIHISVIDDLEDQFNGEQEDNPDGDETFVDFLARVFADGAYCVAALNGNPVQDCLEAYDAIYDEIITVLSEI
jgi:hypothetical protein